jgi:hypothetical protein
LCRILRVFVAVERLKQKGEPLLQKSDFGGFFPIERWARFLRSKTLFGGRMSDKKYILPIANAIIFDMFFDSMRKVHILLEF